MLLFQLPEIFGGVRSIYPQRPGRNDGNIYVGTTKNNILEGSLQRRFNQVQKIISCDLAATLDVLKLNIIMGLDKCNIVIPTLSIRWNELE